MPRSSLKLFAVSAALVGSSFACAVVAAQAAPKDNSVHPITSLPKAPNDPSNRPTPPTAAPAATPAATPTPEAMPASSAVAVPEAAPAAPAPVYAPAPALQGSLATPPAPAQTAARLQRRAIRPFSTVAIGVNFGIGGVGVQLAVPLSQTFNARVGGDFFSYTYNETTNGLQYSGDLKFRAANFNLDWFPFHGAFRISPGVTIYNGNNLNAAVLAPGGQTFSLADVNYLSSATDPVHGTASLTFGKRTAPQITAGFGNMIPRSGKHFSVPFEIGFEYIGPPLIQLQLAGTACTGSGLLIGCVNAGTDPTVQANRVQEQNELNSDINGLRFYPVVRLGVSYAF